MSQTPLKVAIVHDYLREYGGAERVVEALHELFPEAPVYTAFVDSQALGIHWANFKNWDIRETNLTKLPFYKKLFSPYRLFAPHFFSTLDLSEFDLVISSSNAYFAKAVKVREDAVHICYCHTPARSLYGYTTMSDWQKNPLTKFFGSLINHYLRMVDFEVAQKVTHFIANSEETQKRITKFYRRESTVINPPVNVAEQLVKKEKTTDPYYIYVNRLALAKHPELAVEAATKLNVPLKVVGSGKMLDQLKEMAGPTVEFMGAVNDKQLHDLYAGAKALLYPVEDEDFGIVPVEAMGFGLPVIAHLSGGPQETIIEEKTGLFFHELTVDALVEAMLLADRYDFDREAIHTHALQFNTEHFAKKLTDFISDKCA